MSEKRSIWLRKSPYYEDRCGRCGKYKDEEDLREHWFFSGVYCITCILCVLYDNCRSEKEMEK